MAPENEVENLNTYELFYSSIRRCQKIIIEGEREFVKINAIEAHITSGDIRKGKSLFYNDGR